MALVLGACAPRAADFDPRPRIVRSSEVSVDFGWPGDWTWQLEVEPGGAFRWRLSTLGEEQSLDFDGKTAHYRIGGAEVARDETPEDVLSLSRFFIAVYANLLPLPAKVVRQEIGPGRERLRFGSGQDWEIRLDRYGRVVEASGEVQIPTVGTGKLVARFADFRRVGEMDLPFRIGLSIGGRRFARERVIDHRPEGRIRTNAPSVHSHLGAPGG